MASLKALKIRIGSVKSTQKITKAMKMVAAAKLRRAQQKRPRRGPMPSAWPRSSPRSPSKVTVGPADAQAARRHGQGRHPPDHRRDVGDRGLAGAFNTNIVRAARRKADELIGQGKTVLFYIVGRKGRPVLQRLLPQEHHRPVRHQRDEGADLRRRAGDREGHHRPLSRPTVSTSSTSLYANFQSTLVQEPSRPDHPGPARSGRRPGERAASLAAVEYEPDEEEILADLLPRNVAVQIYRALLENQAGFYGSQMTAMDNATRNAGDMINRLTIQYNRTRQAAITTELVEIISGAEAL